MSTNNFHIRLIDAKDTAEVLKIYAYYVEYTHISFEYAAPNKDEFLTRIQSTLIEFPWLVCLYNNKVIGYAYAHKHRLREAYQWSPESTIYLASDFHTKGIGRILYETLFALLKLQGYQNVFAGVALPNEKSVGIHRRMGFEEIGIFKVVGFKKGKWHDTQWFQLNLNQSLNEPEKPLSLAKALSSVEFSEIVAKANQLLAKIK